MKNPPQGAPSAAPFTHHPRPAEGDPRGRYAPQRRYGAGRWAAFSGVASADGACSAHLFRLLPDPTAELRLESPHGHVRAHFTPEALRELARCLIDAAADIEQEGGVA